MMQEVERLIDEYAERLNLRPLADVAKQTLHACPIRVYGRPRSVIALAYLYRAACMIGLPRRIQNAILSLAPEHYATRTYVLHVAREIDARRLEADVWKHIADLVRQRLGDRVADELYRVAKEFERRGLTAGRSRAVVAATILYHLWKTGRILTTTAEALAEMLGVDITSVRRAYSALREHLEAIAP